MSPRIVVIGASLNGITALVRLMKDLPKGFPAPILIVQHVAPHAPGVLPHILSGAGSLPVVHAKDGDEPQPGTVYVAPPDRHLVIVHGRLHLSHGPKENLTRPAVDPLFRSAAIEYGPAVIGVVLTGQLDDGTAGLMAIKDQGGIAVVQDPAEANAPSMPLSALHHVHVDHRCGMAEMAALLVRLVGDPMPGVDPQVPTLLEIEARIASGTWTVEDWWHLEQMSAPSSLTCPECRSALVEIREPRLLRFRCRSGHAYAAESLMSGQAEERETMLGGLFGAVIQGASLARRLAELPEHSGDRGYSESMKARADRLSRHADDLSAWMRATVDLVVSD